MIDERDPDRFQRMLAVASASAADVFLADPAWSAAQRRELDQLSAPDAAQPDGERRGWLMIPSGGTGGRLKFARHDQDTLAAAVAGFCAHFGTSQVNAVGVLPLHHVSGLMAWMRCALTGGTYVSADWRTLERGVAPAMGGGDRVISLVPTQLQRLLAVPAAVAWLRGFRAIFVGGGPAWSSLLECAAAARLPLAPSYGMTETAAMVTAQRPAEFLAGNKTAGAPLPHATIRLGSDGVVHVAGDSLFRGYFPDWREAREFETEDLGQFDATGHLTILGRRDAVIITGGKKVNPADVEDALRASGEFADVAVIGVPDPEWGEVVVACYPVSAAKPDFTRATEALASHQRPKRFVAIADWPRNAQGKVNHAALRAIVLARTPVT